LVRPADNTEVLPESTVSSSGEGTLVNRSSGVSPTMESGQGYYGFLLERIKEIDSRSTLLRGPAHFNPAQTSSTSSDIDILVPAEFTKVKAFLKQQGFRRVYKPQVYLERFRRWLPGVRTPFTIDLYKAERWGLGFRLAHNGHTVADPEVACLIHAVADGKGIQFFEQQLNGPPWSHSEKPKVRFGPIGQVLWRTNRMGLVTLYLLATNVIRPEPMAILRNLLRRLLYRAWQLKRKTGTEVALLGVDGTGKTSVANALLELPAPVKLIYLGPHDFQTRIMRWVARHKVPAIVRQVTYRFDLLARRLTGWISARKGWIVIYDRHPAEGLDPADRSLRNFVKTALERLHAWPVDHTFWLTGDYRSIYFRKKEYPAEKLRSIDERYGRVLEHYGISFQRINVTENDFDSVTDIVRTRVMGIYRERISTEDLPGPLQEILT
jgi:hypothetical protein